MEKFVLLPQDKYQRLLDQSKPAKDANDAIHEYVNTETVHVGDRDIEKSRMQPPPGKRDEEGPPIKKVRTQRQTKMKLNWISL